MTNPSFSGNNLSKYCSNQQSICFLIVCSAKKTQRSEIYRFCLYTLTRRTKTELPNIYHNLSTSYTRLPVKSLFSTKLYIHAHHFEIGSTPFSNFSLYLDETRKWSFLRILLCFFYQTYDIFIY